MLTKKNKLIFFSAAAIFVFFVFGMSNASAATLKITTSKTNLFVGEIATLWIAVNTEGVAINNSEANIQYPTDLVEVLSVSRGSSVFSMWVEEPTFSNTTGVINFNGGLPTPGYAGSSGNIISITVRAKKAGQADFSYSGAAVRANDGLGTNVLTGQSGTTLVIAPKEEKSVIQEEKRSEVPTQKGEKAPLVTLEILSPTHPDQNQWYSNNNPEFKWNLPNEVLEVRTLISKSQSSEPSVSYIPPISFKKVDTISDGIYYFKLQARTSSGWGPISSYKIKIDTSLPTIITTAKNTTTDQKITTESWGGQIWSTEGLTIGLSYEFMQIFYTIVLSIFLAGLFLIILILLNKFYNLNQIRKLFSLTIKNLVEKVRNKINRKIEVEIDNNLKSGNYLEAFIGYVKINQQLVGESRDSINNKIQKAIGLLIAEKNFRQAKLAINLGSFVQAKALIDSSDYINDQDFKYNVELKDIYKKIVTEITEEENKSREKTYNLKRELDKTEQSLKEANSHLLGNEDVLKWLQKELSGHQKLLEEKETAISKLEAKYNSLVNSTETEKTSLGKEIEITKNKYTEALSKLEVKYNSLANSSDKEIEIAKYKYTEALGLLEKAKIEANDQVTNLKKKLLDKDKAHSSLQKEIESGKSQVDLYQKKIVEIIGLLEKTKGSVEEKNEEIANLRTLVSSGKKKIEELSGNEENNLILLKQMEKNLKKATLERQKAEEIRKKGMEEFKKKEEELKKTIAIEKSRAKSLISVISKFNT